MFLSWDTRMFVLHHVCALGKFVLSMSLLLWVPGAVCAMQSTSGLQACQVAASAAAGECAVGGGDIYASLVRAFREAIGACDEVDYFMQQGPALAGDGAPSGAADDDLRITEQLEAVLGNACEILNLTEEQSPRLAALVLEFLGQARLAALDLLERRKFRKRLQRELGLSPNQAAAICAGAATALASTFQRPSINGGDEEALVVELDKSALGYRIGEWIDCFFAHMRSQPRGMRSSINSSGIIACCYLTCRRVLKGDINQYDEMRRYSSSKKLSVHDFVWNDFRKNGLNWEEVGALADWVSIFIAHEITSADKESVSREAAQRVRDAFLPKYWQGLANRYIRAGGDERLIAALRREIVKFARQQTPTFLAWHQYALWASAGELAEPERVDIYLKELYDAFLQFLANITCLLRIRLAAPGQMFSFCSIIANFGWMPLSTTPDRRALCAKACDSLVAEFGVQRAHTLGFFSAVQEMWIELELLSEVPVKFSPMRMFSLQEQAQFSLPPPSPDVVSIAAEVGPLLDGEVGYFLKDMVGGSEQTSV